MKFLPLFELTIRHSYYAGSRCPDFLIDADPVTRTVLQNHRCLLKSRTGGITVIAPVAADATPFISIPAGTRFSFQLRLQNADFSLFTDPVSVITNPANTAGGPTCNLTYPATGGFDSTISAQVDITLSPAPLDAGPVQFAIEFTARAFYWSYYFVTDLADASAGFTLIDTAATTPLQFSSENQTLPAPPTGLSDPVADLLAGQYPGLQRWRFVSAAPVPCRQQARKQLELRLGDSTLFEQLPNPALCHFARLPIAAGRLSPQDSLYQVLRHISDPSLTKV